MATVKMCTDIPRSKILAKILKPETADMHYCYDSVFKELESTPTVTEEDGHFELFPKDIPCWSLATLFSVLPHIQEFYPILEKINDTYICRYKGSGMLTDGANPIDACVDMILKLHELNLL